MIFFVAIVASMIVERGIVCQNGDDVKASESREHLVIAGESIAALQLAQAELKANLVIEALVSAEGIEPSTY